MLSRFNGRRAFSLLLIAALVCAQVPPAAAGGLSRKTGRAAPVRTDISLAPNLALSAPSVAPALPPRALAQPQLAAPMAPALPIAGSAPQPAAAARALESMAQALPPVQEPAPAQDLERVQADFSRSFDHSRAQAAPESLILAGPQAGPGPRLAEPEQAPARASRPAVPAPKKAWLGQSDARASLLAGGSLASGALAAMSPWLWHAAPVHSVMDPLAFFSVIAGTVLGGGLLAPAFLSWLARKVRKQPQPGEGWYGRLGRRSKAGVLAAGLALGAVMGGAPNVLSYPLHEITRGGLTPHSELLSRDFNARLAACLSRNRVGRETLDKLRDRGGVVRMPRFVVTEVPENFLATYDRYTDWVNIPTRLLQKRGWSVESFLHDPAKWDAIIYDMQTTWIHELEHAAQRRRPLGSPGLFALSLEYEYEAYLRSHFYAQAAMESGQRLPPDAVLTYAMWLEDLDKKLAWVDSAYPNDIRLDAPAFNAWLADLRASWPSHRRAGYMLAADQLRGEYPHLAEMYETKAMKAAGRDLK